MKPIDPVARNATAQTMMIPTVTRGSPRIVRMSWTFVRCLAHSGQRMPTGVGVMQSGQIGRPHDEQETPVVAVGMAVAGLGGGPAAEASISRLTVQRSGPPLAAFARPAGTAQDPPVTRAGR